MQKKLKRARRSKYPVALAGHRISADMANRIRSLADSRDVSESDIVRDALDAYLRQNCVAECAQVRSDGGT